MASSFKLQIASVDTGKVVEWAPGLAAETELIDNLCARVQVKGIGIFRTEAHVLADIREATEELLHDLKKLI